MYSRPVAAARDAPRRRLAAWVAISTYSPARSKTTNRRDELLDLVYADYREISDRAIDSHIKDLRRKIDVLLPGRAVIHAVYSSGYRLKID